MEKKRIGTQIDKRFLTYLNEYSKEYNLSMSKLIRKALTYYLRFSHKDEKTSNPTIIVAKNEFSFILNNLKEIELKKLAEIAFENALIEREEYINKFLSGEEREDFKVKPRVFLRMLKFQLFGYEGQNWFKDIRFSFHENRLTIGGIHDLNINFSIFFKYFMKKQLSVYDYNLTNEKLDMKKVFLDFNK